MRAWNLASESFDDGFAGADHGFCLVAEKSCGTDFLLQFGRIGVGESPCIGIFLVQSISHLVYADVGALRGKNGGNHQLQWIGVVEFAHCVGIGLVESAENRSDAFGVRGVGSSATNG